MEKKMKRRWIYCDNLFTREVQTVRVVTTAEMKQIEKRADETGVSYRQMMENAGTAAYKVIREKYPNLEKMVVIAGKGNNGGDGFVVARLAAMDSMQVQVILIEGAPVTEDAAANFEKLKSLPVKITDMDKAWNTTESDVIVDALYGTGFHGELRAAGKLACQYMNNQAGKVAALDIPSGMNSDTGKAAEGVTKADITVVFDSYKYAHAENRDDICGEIVLENIGIPEECHA